LITLLLQAAVQAVAVVVVVVLVDTEHLLVELH
jgi:hypothetical protein